MKLTERYGEVINEMSSLEVHIDNFLRKIQSSARITGVEIITDMDELKAKIMVALDQYPDERPLKDRGGPDFSRILAGRKNEEKLEESVLFRKKLMDATVAFVNTISRLSGGKKIDKKKIVEIVASIKFKNKKD